MIKHGLPPIPARKGTAGRHARRAASNRRMMRQMRRNIAIFTRCFAILHPCYILGRLLDRLLNLWYYNLRKGRKSKNFKGGEIP